MASTTSIGVLAQALHALVEVELQLRLHVSLKTAGAPGTSKDTSLT